MRRPWRVDTGPVRTIAKDFTCIKEPRRQKYIVVGLAATG